MIPDYDDDDNDDGNDNDDDDDLMMMTNLRGLPAPASSSLSFLSCRTA